MVTHLTLREMRKRNNYTAKNVADHFNVHLNTVYNWEKRTENVAFKHIIKLVDYYGYTISDLTLPKSLKP